MGGMAALEVLVSPPGTGKTYHCIELFKDRVLRSKGGIDSRSYFVLPSREHADRIQSLVLRDVPGLFNAHILTIQDLADRVVAVPGKGRPTESIRRSAVAEALGPAGPESVYGYFRESVGLRGFQELALEAIREFKAGLLSAGDLSRRAHGLCKNDPVFASKYKDFSILLKRYDAKLEALGLSEADDDLAAFDPSGGQDEPLELVIFDGFYHFTRAQKKLLTIVAARAERTIVSLTLDPAHPAGEALFGYPERTRRFLLAAGFRQTGRLAENHRVKDPALRHLAANLFSQAPEIYKKPAPVAVFSAPSRRVEYEMIAREIRRLYRSESCHFSDFCVILRAVSGRRALIESVFGEYGVPVSIHERRRLTESGLASAFLRLLRVSADDWKREDVVFLAKSSYFRGTLTSAEALELERAALRENLVSGREAWRVLESAGTLSAGARGFLAGLLEAEARLGASSGPHVFAAHAEAFLKPLAAGVQDDLDAAASRSIAMVLAAGRRRYTGGAETFDAVRYILEIAAALESGLLSLKPSGRNRVQVYDAVMALPKEYKTVFVADLLEKTFPLSVTEDPLFKDQERRAMNGAEPVLDERIWRLSGERYFFYMSVTRAREKVYSTPPPPGEDEKPVLRSFFVDEALRCFAPGMCRAEAKGPAGFLPTPAEWETEADVVRGLAGFLREPEPCRPAFFAPLAEHWQESTAFVRALESRPAAGPVRLHDPRVLEAMRTFAGPFSATGFDAFYKCAYRHFAESMLKLRRPPEEFQDAAIGTLLHKVLYDYFEAMPKTRLASGDYLKDDGVMERELEAILDARFAGAFLDQPLYRRSMFRASMGTMLRGTAKLERRAAAESGLTPARFEYEFGKGGADYLRMPDESGEILLKGSIDRIDVDSSGKRAVVIDYKKSSRNLKDKLKKGEEIQLPLYSYAARKLLGLEPAGVEHRILKTGKRENPGYSTEELDALLVTTEARIREAVRRIRRGEIAVEPKECDYCPFDAVCRIDSRKDLRVT